MATMIRRFFGEQRLLPMLCLFAAVLAILVMLSNATENSDSFGAMYSWLLLAGAIGLLLLSVLIGFALSGLIKRYRYREPGSRLTLRLVIVFVLISAVPVGVVYFFSIQFLNRGIESWFDVRVQGALEDALGLTEAALNLRNREVLRQTERVADDLVGLDEGLVALRLGEMLAASEADELTLFGQSGRIIATAGIDPSIMVPDRPSEWVVLHVNEGNPYVKLELIPDVGLHVRVVIRVTSDDPTQEAAILQGLFKIPERLNELADSVRTAHGEYDQLVYLRQPLKTSFIGSLSLVLLFGVLSALWAALFLARRLVQPIRDLAEGTRAVAAGQYDKQLALPGNDELGFLVHSFNQMTRNLSQARDAAEQSQQVVEQQRAFLEAVLSRLSTGVMTLDINGIMYTHNAAASQILGVNLEVVDATQPGHVKEFFAAVKPHLASTGDWREEMTLFSGHGRQVLMCRGSSLPESVGLSGGHVLVFDDITTLLQAQRNAAWTEVARRLAHEIKNPLTPIQLAAERLRHKFLGKMDEDAARVLDRSTHTIVQQVQAMKDMVNDFNEYARPAQGEFTTLSLNEFIGEVLYLYKGQPDGIRIQLQLDPADPRIKADRGRLRQLVHNLAQNAIAAMRGGNGSNLWVTTQRHHEPGGQWVELRFDDDGPGLPDSAIGDIFEPYVTTKPKGTGLGLAIVKKIVEEHGGLIELTARPGGGACAKLRFPAITDADATTNTAGEAKETSPATNELEQPDESEAAKREVG